MRSLILWSLLCGIALTAACTSENTTPVPTRTATQSKTAASLRVETATVISPTNTTVPPTASPPPTATSVPPTPLPTLTRKPTRDTIPDGMPQTLQEWNTLVAEISASPDAQARVDALWDTLVQARSVPFIVNDRVIFLYRGDAASVYWHGDFSFWQKPGSIEGERVPNTDLWYGIANFPRDSRTDYQIVVNDAQEMLDPANPSKRNDGLDVNNILTMPAFQITDFTRRGKDVPKGNMTDWLAFDSKVMGHTVNYAVYTPPNYDALQKLPVLYVTDGERFAPDNIGAMNAVLDNLIAAKRIAPVIAVYVDERTPGTQDNRRVDDFLVEPEQFAQFITQELVPAIDTQYHTNASRDARVLVGASFGGVFGTYAALRYPETFGNLAAFSPAYWVIENPNGAGSGASSGAQRMNEFINRAYACGKTDVPCPASPQKIFYSSGIPGWDVGNLNPRAEALRARGDAIQIFTTPEGHNWGTWSGLTDEMLEYFFAAPQP